MPQARKRSVGSIKQELIKKSQEAALSAVQIFNNPSITFKSETYCVLMIVAWTYLLHAYYRSKSIEYRYFEQRNQRKVFDRTKNGAYKYWELERCLNDRECPIDHATKTNLKFLIGLRHEIEHQMTMRLDDLLSARFQACCLNFNEYIKNLFGDKFALDSYLNFSLQLASITPEQVDLLQDKKGLPKNIESYIMDFDEALSQQEYGDPKYAYRILFVPKTANRKGQADRVVEFVKADSEVSKSINHEYALIKETEKKKYLPGKIVEIMQEQGYDLFKMYQHTVLWKRLKAKDESKGYGKLIEGTWYWYQLWLDAVNLHCKENPRRYQS